MWSNDFERTCPKLTSRKRVTNYGDSADHRNSKVTVIIECESGKVCGGRCVLSGTAVHQDSSAVLVELITVLRGNVRTVIVYLSPLQKTRSRRAMLVSAPSFVSAFSRTPFTD